MTQPIAIALFCIVFAISYFTGRALTRFAYNLGSDKSMESGNSGARVSLTANKIIVNSCAYSGNVRIAQFVIKWQAQQTFANVIRYFHAAAGAAKFAAGG